MTVRRALQVLLMTYMIVWAGGVVGSGYANKELLIAVLIIPYNLSCQSKLTNCCIMAQCFTLSSKAGRAYL